VRLLGSLLVVLLAVAPIACDRGSDGGDRAGGDSDAVRSDGAPPAPPAGTSTEPAETVPAGDGRAVREWIEALDAGEYKRAASFFARGAIVEQADEFRLRDRRAAEIFNRGLPCRADLSDLEDEGRTVVGTFRLRDGPGGHCEGEVRVRFTIRHGRFLEWRQLGEPPGEIA
jgi:hypothetical protein